ncbi:MAG TPA: ubiquinone biosynthesis protein UbiH [Gammaproteobacteria bacterium]|nr:ubiquinone biosynthesis protein UbiH [Gammaproteobacteria bacterium]
MNGPDLDVLVVGGGVVGVATALTFAHSGCRTGIVDVRARQAMPASGDPYDARVLALTHASVNLFERLGAWPAMPAGRSGCYEAMEVWDDRSPARVRLEAGASGMPCLGHIVEVAVLQAALESRLAGQVREWRPARLRGLTVLPECVRVDLDGERVEAALLVGADGAASRVRELAGIGWDERDYGEHALVTVVESDWPHGDVARQVFLATGPLALLPLGYPRHAALVWTLPEALAAERLELDDASFIATLTRASKGVLGGLQPLTPRATHPLRRGHASEYVATRVALVGDAAHTIHPLAGQGANLGFMDAASLCEVVADARRAGRDPGSRSVLRRYARWRRGENEGMQLAMDGFRWLFNDSGSEGGELWRRGLRTLGMRAFDHAGPLKRALIERATGLSGDLPLLARSAAAQRSDIGAW